MKLDKFNTLLLESAGVGLAILDLEDRKVVFGNKRFMEWFPDAIGLHLDEIAPDIDKAKVEDRIAKDRAYTCETAITIKRRSVTLALSLSRHVHNDINVLILECQNISKIKELEYMIESYSKMVEKQNRTLSREKERVEKLLLNVMPKKVYEELKTFGVTAPQLYEDASILMLDFIGFTDMAIAQDPAGIISELNDIFSSFDRIAEQFGCERIKTIGDAYMAVSGIPEANPEHAVNIAKLGVLMVRYLNRRNKAHRTQWKCRIGINSGTVIGSIVGIQKYVYDIFGPGVNLAARLESLCDPMQITLCEDMYDLIKNDFNITALDVVEIKGFGKKQLYRLESGRDELTIQSEGLADQMTP